MTCYELKSCIKWFKGIGVNTLLEVKTLLQKYKKKNKTDILNFANGLYVHGLSIKDL